MIRGLVGAFLLLTLAFQTAAHGQNDRPGEFDFYVLALSWSPSYCEAQGAQRADNEQCSSRRPYAFVVHGLWPQYERGYPRSCVTPAPRISEGLIRSMLDLMPARGLVIHQWRTHGTCAGLPPDRYFAAVRVARERINIPERFRHIDKYTMVSPAAVERAFIAANPGLRADMLATTCDSRRLHEVRICMTRSFEFRACPEIDRRTCRVPRVVMPPVRGG